MKKSEEVIEEFYGTVNMDRRELSSWLETEESRSVGQVPEGAEESIGHYSGEKIVEFLEKKDFSQEDIQHMKRVVSYIHRHLAQRPSGDPTHTRWRYSLMNWGHDPLKDKEEE